MWLLPFFAVLGFWLAVVVSYLFAVVGFGWLWLLGLLRVRGHLAITEHLEQTNPPGVVN
jgi:hypothetical protein